MGIGTEHPHANDARKAPLAMFPSLRFLLLAPLPLMLAACVSAGPAAADAPMSSPAVIGVDLGGSAPVAMRPGTPASADLSVRRPASQPPRGGEMQMAHAGHNDAHGTGTINAVDAAAHKLNLSHGPISELGWPAMTMEFPVAPTVDLRALKPGMKVDFTIEQGQMGPVIQSVTPAAGGR